MVGSGQGRSDEGCVRADWGIGNRSSDVAVLNAYQVVFRIGPFGERLRYRDRAMFAAGAPYPDVKVCLPLSLVPGQEERQEIRISIDELGSLGGSKYILPNRRVSAVLLSKLLNEMGVSKKANIHHEVAIEGNSVFEPKGEEVNPHARSSDRSQGIQELPELATQGVDVERGGVYEEICRFLNGLETRSFTGDSVPEGGVLSRVKAWVRASRFAVAADYRLIVRV